MLVRACVCVCVFVCKKHKSMYRLQFKSLDSFRAEWFWNALVKPFPAQDMAQVLSSAVAGELPPWANAWAERKETAAQSLLATACLSPSQASASASLGQIPPFPNLSHIVSSISLFFP